MPDYDYFLEAMEMVKKASAGRLVVEVYAEGALMATPEIFDAVSTGAIETTSIWTNQWASKNSAFSLFAYTPFGMSFDELMVWYYYGEGRELAQELFGRYNIKFFPGYSEGPDVGPWSKEPYPTLESMKGKSARIGPGPGQEILRRVGVDVVFITGGELYAALDRGVVDMAEWGQPSSDYVMGLWEIAPYLQMPGWFQPTLGTDVEVNMDAWNELPDDLKAIFELGAVYYSGVGTFGTKGMDMDNMQKLVDVGVEIVRLSDEDLATLKAITKEVMAEMAAENPDFKRIYESQQEFHQKYVVYQEATAVP